MKINSHKMDRLIKRIKNKYHKVNYKKGYNKINKKEIGHEIKNIKTNTHKTNIKNFNGDLRKFNKKPKIRDKTANHLEQN